MSVVASIRGLPDTTEASGSGEQIPLSRLRHGGPAHSFGFAIYSAAATAGYIMMRQPSQYASTLGRRLPCSPISRTSGALPPGARNQTSIPAPGTGVKPDMPAGSSVAACRTAGDPQQHTRG